VATSIQLQQQLNRAVSQVMQYRNPFERAKHAGELMERLQIIVNTELAKIRREAVAEALHWPNMSMAKVATELGVSKSTVAKLASPDLREAIASDVRARLQKGFNPPPPKR
jgi:AraC-like DNA-binding protein